MSERNTPDGWDELTVSQVTTRHFSGPSPTCEERNMASRDEWGLLKTTAITWDGWNAAAHKVPPRVYWGNENIEVRRGDVLVTKAGPRHRVGVVVYVSDTPAHLMVSGKMVGLTPDRNLVLPQVLAGSLSIQSPQKYLDERTTGMAESQVNFTNDVLLATPIRVPPIREQQRIAEVLDTTNDAIRATERLIAKLKETRGGLARHIFPSLRQVRAPSELPSGSLRLRDTGTWLSGGTPNTANPRYWDGDIPWISAASLHKFDIVDSDRRVTEEGAVGGTQVVSAGTVLFVVRGMSLKSEFRVGVTKCRVAFGQDCKAIIPKSGIDALFLAHSLRASEHQILQLVDEAGHGTGRLETKLIQELAVDVPTWDEQLRLVNVIGSVDNKLTELTNELTKLSALKQGLMDDLLTGRVRVGASA